MQTLLLIWRGQGTGFPGIPGFRKLAIWLWIGAGGFWGCRNEGFPPERTLVVRQEQTPLLDAPGENGRELRQLPQGALLLDLGEVSRFATRLHFGDSLIEAPWLRVQTADGGSGWVFAAATPALQGDFQSWMMQKRLQCFFGPSLTGQRNQWAKDVPAADTDAAIAAVYRQGLELRDTLAQLLYRRAEPNQPALKPDFFWLNEALPGFIIQQVGPGARPYPYLDFRYWAMRATQTGGEQDNAFFQACLQAFPIDSVESAFPLWTIQTGENTGSSQLGLGHHLQIFRALDQALAAGPLFQPELQTMKDMLVEDIAGKHSTYWQPVEKILTELNEITASNFSCLDERDRLALQERLVMLENAEANGIPVNLRSGE